MTRTQSRTVGALALAVLVSTLVVVGIAALGGTAVALDNGTELVVDADGNDSKSNTFLSISDALDAANSSDTIVVHDGTYDGPVVVDTNVTLRADNESGATISYEPDSPTGQSAVDVTADGATVDGFEIERVAATDREDKESRHFAQGVRISGSDVTVKNNTVSGVGLSDFDGVDNKAIMVIDDEDVTGVEVTSNDVEGFAGPLTFAAYYGGSVEAVEFSDNSLEGYISDGISIGEQNGEVNVSLGEDYAHDAESNTYENTTFHFRSEEDALAFGAHTEMDGAVVTDADGDYVVGDGMSIQDAVNASSDGDEIQVRPGTYDGFAVDKNVSVVGDSGAIIDVKSGIGIDFEKNAGEPRVEGFTVENWTLGGIGQGYSSAEGTSPRVINNTVLAPDVTTAHGNSIQVNGNGSIVKDNTVTVAFLGDGEGGENKEHDSAGILVYGGYDVKVVNNTITTGRGVGIGIGGGDVIREFQTLPAVNANVSGNTIEDTKTGFTIEKDVEGTLLHNNTVSGTEVALRQKKLLGFENDGTTYEPETTTLTDNNFTDNGIQLAMYDEDGNYSQAGEFVIEDSNNFDQYVVQVEDDERETGTSVFSNVQDAIDEAEDGDEIHVEPGTYDGKIVVNKSVDLVAPEGATVTYTPDSQSGEPTVSVTENDTSVSGFDVVRKVADNRDDTSTRFAQGIRVSGSNVTVDANSVTGEGFKDASNAGIMVLDDESGGSGETVTNVTIKNNSVSGFAGPFAAVEQYGGSIDDVTFESNTPSENDYDTVVVSGADVDAPGYDVNLSTDEGDFYFQSEDDARTAAEDEDFEVNSLRNESSGDIFVTDGMSIQDAVDAANDGDTIEVANGTYDERVQIGTENVTLVGSGGPGVDESDQSVINSSDGPVVQVNAANVTVSGFTITGAEGDGENGQGVDVNGDDSDTDNVRLTDLVVRDNHDRALVVDYTDNATIENVVVKDNHDPDAGGDDPEDDWETNGEADGITLWYTNNSQVIDVQAINNSDNGVYANGNNNRFENVTAKNNGDEGLDISSEEVTGGAKVVDLNSSGNNAEAIEIEGNDADVNVTIENAYLADSPRGLFVRANNNGTVTVQNSEFENNPTHVNDTADALDLGDVEEANDFDPKVVVYEDDETISGVYGEIQAAVDESSNGDTVEVGPGTYEGQVTIDKDVTLEGPNAETAGDADSRTEEATINGTIRVGNPSTKTGADNVTIAGLELAGDGDDRGIGATASDNLTIENTVIDDYLTGVSLQFAGDTPENVTIRDNEISNSTAGVGSTEDVTALEITDNTFVNNGEGIGLGEDVELAGDADDVDGLIEENSFEMDSSDQYAVGNWTVENPPAKYTEDASILVQDGDSIQDAIKASAAGDTVRVASGTYDEDVTVDKNITVSGPDATLDGRVDVKSDGVTIEGLTITNASRSSSVHEEVDGILVSIDSDTEEQVTIRDVTIEDIGDQGSPDALEGIHLFGDTSTDGVLIENVDIQNVSQPDSGASGIKVQADVSNVTIEDSSIEDVSGSWSYGVVTTPSNSADGVPAHVVVENTEFEDLTAESEDAFGVGIGVDKLQPESDVNAVGDETTVHNSSFVDVDVGVLNKDSGNDTDATHNYWGAPTGPGGVEPGTGANVSANVTFEPYYPNEQRLSVVVSSGSAELDTSDGQSSATIKFNVSGSEDDDTSVERATVQLNDNVTGSVEVAEVDDPGASSGLDEVLESTSTVVEVSVPQSAENDSGTVSLTVKRSNLGGSPSNLVIAHYTDGKWKELETSVVETTSTNVTIEAETDSFSPFAVGQRAQTDQPEDDDGGQPSLPAPGDGDDAPGKSLSDGSVAFGFDGDVARATVEFDGAASGRVSAQALDQRPADVPAIPDGDGVAFVDVTVPAEHADDSATLQFTVDADAIGDASADDVVVYHHADGEWTALDTSVLGETSDGVVVEATTPGFSVFGVAVQDTTQETTEDTTDETTDDTTDDAGDETTTDDAGDETTAPTDTTTREQGGFSTLTLGALVVLLAAMLGLFMLARRRA